MKSILFVCNGNVFRSMTAEFCLRDYLSKHRIRKYKTASAGIFSEYSLVHPATFTTLASLGIDVSLHRQTKLNRDRIARSDLVIAMATDHQEHILKNYNRKAPLFNEIAFGVKSSITDLPQIADNAAEHYKQSVLHIYQAMPTFYHNLVQREIDKKMIAFSMRS